MKVDPKNADIVYTASVVTWKSVDGGKTFSAFRGAPGGDDYHRIWINPNDSRTMIIASDQGAIVTVNGGESWSSWLNQPTAAFYHVSTDFDFPYRVCSGQQESGSACVRSRGDDGRILGWDWHPAGVEEYGYAAPDPLNPDIVFGGKVTRYDRRTGDIQDVGPHVGRVPGFRSLRTAPLVFSTVDPHTLFFAENVVWKTKNGGRNWTQISPDLTRTDSIVPPNVGTYAGSANARARHPGVVYTVAPSYVNLQRIWAGTDDGLIQTTADGGAHWTDVTPPQLRAKPWSKVSIMDAGRFDANTAYAAVNTLRLDDMTPHIYRTHDGGKTWKHITNGIAGGAVINVVREDSRRKGLLFAGSEDQVWVSIDDGDHWSSLRLNMPATSIRDLVIKDDDIVVGTHGRSFYVLDDIAALRQVSPATAAAAATLYKPANAWRFRFSKYPDTPIPPDEPWAPNPPDGAIIDYSLGAGSSGPAKLEILDARGAVIRTYASTDTAMAPADIGNTPRYWIRPTQVLSSAPGFHRFVWDLHYERPAFGAPDSPYPISATPHDTPREPRGPVVLPGRYTARLTVGARSYEQAFDVVMDPRVRTSAAALRQAHEVSVALFEEMKRDSTLSAELSALRARVSAAVASDTAVAAFDGKLLAVLGGAGGRRGAPAGPTITSLGGDLFALFGAIESSDAAVTDVQLAAARRLAKDLAALAARVQVLRGVELSALNASLRTRGSALVISP